ncbi:hypothetical protein GTH32_04580 [Alteromonas sp. 345S023]|uniref:Uncharacterized protein n=1 Tax=Alteromonas profundi TaxID=2696062 RepID=A0A7X5LJG4_9ALTE|nr:hypothetical protein [Alteromonas profundi]NDV90473.1 hypothetical protein [Alteromonas profundi]
MRQITKAIYLLVEKYHRLYGLELYLFSHSGFGPGYWGFQVAGNRTWSARSSIVNDDGIGKKVRNSYSLVSYLHDVSLPSWSLSMDKQKAKGQPRLHSSKQLRTHTVVNWLEKEMGLINYFNQHHDAIERWRGTYTVEAAEKYILTINLAGLAATERNSLLVTPGQCYDSYYDNSEFDQIKEDIYTKLRAEDRKIDIFGTKGKWFCRNGLALIDNTVVNFWQEYVKGKSAKEILAT